MFYKLHACKQRSQTHALISRVVRIPITREKKFQSLIPDTPVLKVVVKTFTAPPGPRMHTRQVARGTMPAAPTL